MITRACPGRGHNVSIEQQRSIRKTNPAASNAVFQGMSIFTIVRATTLLSNNLGVIFKPKSASMERSTITWKGTKISYNPYDDKNGNKNKALFQRTLARMNRNHNCILTRNIQSQALVKQENISNLQNNNWSGS